MFRLFGVFVKLSGPKQLMSVTEQSRTADRFSGGFVSCGFRLFVLFKHALGLRFVTSALGMSSRTHLCSLYLQRPGSCCQAPGVVPETDFQCFWCLCNVTTCVGEHGPGGQVTFKEDFFFFLTGQIKVNSRRCQALIGASSLLQECCLWLNMTGCHS